MPPSPAFALLDDALAPPGQARGRLYEKFVRVHACAAPARLDDAWADVERDMNDGLHALLLADYEWGARLHGIQRDDGADRESALHVLMFASMRRLDAREVGAWLDEQAKRDGHEIAGFVEMRNRVDRSEFDAAIDAIHRCIEAGETYQVNYSYRLDAQAFGHPIALYRRLRERQPVAYGALIRLPEMPSGHEWIVSMSPELFVRHRDGLACAMPMKGTAARHAHAQSDRAAADGLRREAKSRAENLMIVDLLRNDLGRLATIGGVRVPRLFDVVPYPTVWQMTSTIEARLRDEVRFPDVMRALFPCGSITGAPKRQTMTRIARIESSARGLYTGAIGWIEPASNEPSHRLQDFCLSVAIRSFTLSQVDDLGRRRACFGVGAGIVIDSEASAEYEETRLKLRYVEGLDPGFRLIETMRVEQRRVAMLDAHLERLKASALKLGFEYDERALHARIRDGIARSVVGDAPHRLRIALDVRGHLDIDAAALPAPTVDPVRVLLSERRLSADELALCAFKTTHRSTYDRAIAEAVAAQAFDCLFFDEHDRLTEGARSNVFVRIDDAWRTPPLNGRVLPGVMRARLLEKLGDSAREAVVTRTELLSAQAIVVCNALRGVLPATIGRLPRRIHAS